MFGSILFGLVINGFHVPGRSETDMVTAFEAIPGAFLGLAAVYVYGARKEGPAEALTP